MDGQSESSSALPWLWVIEALAGFREISSSTLQDLIDVAPVVPDDFCKNTRELVALRCLEELFGSAHEFHPDASSGLDSRVGFDFARSCEDVLQEILHEIPLPNLKMAGTELTKWNVFPFITRKRSSTVKCHLEQLKESIFEGTHPYADYLKERSGLAHGGYPVHKNDGECNDLSEKDSGNSTYAENKGAKGNSVSIILENGNKSSREHLLLNNFSPSKRSRVDSADIQVMGFLHEKQVCINESDDLLRNTKKIKCYAAANFESKKENPEQDNRVTLGEGFKDCHDRCTASNQCTSSSHNEASHDESNIPFNATMMPRHTSAGEHCQQQLVKSVPTNFALPDEIQHKISRSEARSKNETYLQLNDPSVSQKLVATDKAVVDTVDGCDAELSSDGDGYQNEKIVLGAKKHELLSSQLTFGHDFSARTESAEQNLCIKCNEGGQLLICKATTCPLMIHKNCLGVSAQFDVNGNFFCPFCTYSHAVSEYLEAKKKASLARKELDIFISKGIRHQAAELLHEFHKQEHSLSRKSSESEHIHVKNKENDNVVENVNEVSNVHFERSQQPALRSSREVSSGEERDEMLISKSSTGGRVEENEVPTDCVDGDSHDRFSCRNANIVSVNQNNTGEESLQEMLKQRSMDGTVGPVRAHDIEKEEISDDECEKHAISRYTMRFQKRETQYKPPARPQLRRKNISWTAEEEELIREGVQKFGFSDSKIPWKKILAFGSHVFEKNDKCLTAQDLKNKWMNMCRAHGKAK